MYGKLTKCVRKLNHGNRQIQKLTGNTCKKTDKAFMTGHLIWFLLRSGKCNNTTRTNNNVWLVRDGPKALGTIQPSVQEVFKYMIYNSANSGVRPIRQHINKIVGKLSGIEQNNDKQKQSSLIVRYNVCWSSSNRSLLSMQLSTNAHWLCVHFT